METETGSEKWFADLLIKKNLNSQEQKIIYYEINDENLLDWINPLNRTLQDSQKLVIDVGDNKNRKKEYITNSTESIVFVNKITNFSLVPEYCFDFFRFGISKESKVYNGQRIKLFFDGFNIIENANAIIPKINTSYLNDFYSYRTTSESTLQEIIFKDFALITDEINGTGSSSNLNVMATLAILAEVGNDFFMKKCGIPKISIEERSRLREIEFISLDNSIEISVQVDDSYVLYNLDGSIAGISRTQEVASFTIERTTKQI